MPLETIVLILAAYLAIVVLLLSLNIFSLWHWWVKASAIVVCGIFFAFTYVAMISLLGWPTKAQVPERFSLVATRVVEPNQLTGDTGAIYLWLEHVDEENVTSGLPLNHQIAYTDQLAEAVDRAQELLNEGELVQGSLEEFTQDPAVGEAMPQEGQQEQVTTGGNSSPAGGGGAGYEDDGTTLVFNDMPPVLLPTKGVL